MPIDRRMPTPMEIIIDLVLILSASHSFDDLAPTVLTPGIFDASIVDATIPATAGFQVVHGRHEPDIGQGHGRNEHVT